MIYPSLAQMIAELKEWYGWDNDIIKIINTTTYLRIFYRVMLKDKEG